VTDHAEQDEALEALERELSLLLRRARASSGELARELHPELEAGAWGLVLSLEQVASARATDLAAHLGVGKTTMSRQLGALGKLGLVERDPDPVDGRAFLVRLTGEGRRRLAGVRDARRTRYHRLMQSWGHGEVAELARLLGRFNESVDRL
jgi:DNA-binding MarR family transcriptional regulator